MDEKYFWIRVFDYVYERDSNYDSENYGKGVLLDELYLKNIGDREEVKNIVKGRYHGSTSKEIAFAKPKKKDGIYAIVMDSDKFFYDRFYAEIDTYCFWCHKPIKGKASEFPRDYIGSGKWYEDKYDVFNDYDKTGFFCNYDCKGQFRSSLDHEGAFQNKEAGDKGNVFGYIYLIYNRTENIYYIGQTRFMPFFRWQEHIKDGKKGDIKDLSFCVLTEVPKNPQQSDEQNQIFLNNVEAWWISKYQEDGYKVFNISNPKITIEYLKNRFNEMVARNQQIKLIV